MARNDSRSARMAGRAAAVLLTGALAGPASAADDDARETAPGEDQLIDGEAELGEDTADRTSDRDRIRREEMAKRQAQGDREHGLTAEDGEEADEVNEDDAASEEVEQAAPDVQERRTHRGTRQEAATKQQHQRTR